MPKPDKGTTKKRKLQSNIFDDYRCKNLQQNISKLNSTIYKKVHHDQVGFISGMQGCFNICKSIYVVSHIYKMKNKNQMIITIDEGKALDKIHIHSWKKLSSKLVQREHIST